MRIESCEVHAKDAVRCIGHNVFIFNDKFLRS
jgi:hypothetical protein